MLAFVSVVTLVFGGAHYYLWARFVRDSGLPQPWRGLGAALAVLMWLSLPLLVGIRLARPRWSRFAEPPVYHWLGVLWLGIVVLALLDLARLMAWALGRPENPLELHWLLAGAAALVLVLAAVARLGAMRLTVQKVEITLRRWPAALDGYRIVQLSDVHLGSGLARAFMEELVSKANALAPDLIAVTGDLLDGDLESLRGALEPLKGLRAPQGVFYVTGNHEYFHGIESWLPELPGLGMKWLDNTRLRVEAKGAAFELAGVDDYMGRAFGKGPDFDAALSGRDPSLSCVLLAHQPKALPEAARRGVDLVLAGHTHGGQIWPFKHLVRLDQPYVAGLYALDGTQLYVSQGAGFWGPPMRLGTKSEISLIVIRGESR